LTGGRHAAGRDGIRRLFADSLDERTLELTDSRRFAMGITILEYIPIEKP